MIFYEILHSENLYTAEMTLTVIQGHQGWCF